MTNRAEVREFSPVCRNCNGAISAADWVFCPHCGQETRLELPSVFEFLSHTAGRFLALDGRLWRTLLHLVTKPGLLTQSYLAGRRRYFVQPARLFFVLSLVLFGILRLDYSVDPVGAAGKSGAAQSAVLPGSAPVTAEPVVTPSTIAKTWEEILDFSPEALADPLRKRVLHYKNLSRPERILLIDNGSIRFGPYVVFALLPLYAALMQLAYLGRRRRYPQRPHRYGEHLLHGAYLHCTLLLTISVGLLLPWVWLRVPLLLWLLIYLARAQYRVYGGSRWAALLRGLLVAVVYFVFAMITQEALRLVVALL